MIVWILGSSVGCFRWLGDWVVGWSGSQGVRWLVGLFVLFVLFGLSVSVYVCLFVRPCVCVLFVVWLVCGWWFVFVVHSVSKVWIS